MSLTFHRQYQSRKEISAASIPLSLEDRPSAYTLTLVVTQTSNVGIFRSLHVNNFPLSCAQFQRTKSNKFGCKPLALTRNSENVTLKRGVECTMHGPVYAFSGRMCAFWRPHRKVKFACRIAAFGSYNLGLKIDGSLAAFRLFGAPRILTPLSS